MTELTLDCSLAGCHTISLWRDYDHAVIERASGMSLGSVRLTADVQVSADNLFADGVRHVRFDRVIDSLESDAARTVCALTLVRDLTSCGIVVDWQLRAEFSGDEWRKLSHLYPPVRVFNGVVGDGDELQSEWVRGYHLGKCVFRCGPDLLQVRDRRWHDGMRRVTITKPDYLEAVAMLETGVVADNISAHIYADFSAAELIGRVGKIAWWLPYRVRRWPSASIVI